MQIFLPLHIPYLEQSETVLKWFEIFFICIIMLPTWHEIKFVSIFFFLEIAFLFNFIKYIQSQIYDITSYHYNKTAH